MVNCACISSAFCFIVSNALGIAVMVERASRRHDGNHSGGSSGSTFYSRMTSLDSDQIQRRWMHRRNIAPLDQTSHIFNAFAWLFFLTPILQLAWALSRGGKRRVGIHTAIAGFAILGCMTEILSRLLLFGGWGSANWIADSFVLTGWSGGDDDDTIGWKTLEITYTIMHGMLRWVDAFEWICLFVIMILLYFSIATQVMPSSGLSLNFARLGLCIAFFCVLDFATDLLELEDWRTFHKIAVYYTILNTCILLPFWLLWLSCTIQNVMPITNNDDDIIDTGDNIWSPGGITTTTTDGTNEVVQQQQQN